jgi:hypothetical protein
MYSRVGVVSQEAYFCTSDSTRSMSFASNFLTIGATVLTSLWSMSPHSAFLGGYQDFTFSSRIRYRLVSYTHLHPKNRRWNSKTQKNIERKKTKNSFSNLLLSQISRPRPPDPFSISQFTLMSRRNQTLIDRSPLARYRRTCYAISSRPLLQYRGPESSAQYPGPAGRPFPPQYDHST